MSAELAIVAVFVGAIWISTYMAFSLSEDHSIVKAILLFLSYFSILALFQVGNIIVETTAGLSYRFTGLIVGLEWVYGIVGVVLVLYLGYYLMYGNIKQIKEETNNFMRMK